MKITRRLSFLLVIILALSFCFPVCADESSLPPESGDESDVVALSPGIVSGNAAVAYCIDDDQFLYTDRIDERVAPTVATKLVACMVAADLMAQKGVTSDKVQVTVTAKALANAGDIADVRVPMMGFKAGDSYTAKDLISCTLVACANDAVASLAAYFGENYLGGDINTFVEQMNKKAESIGLTNTHFVNATGLDDPDQYSTPREVALIAAAFYRYNELVTLSDVESFLFNGSTTVRSKNFLKSGYYVKGFTNKQAIGLIAGQKDRNGDYCLITASQKDGRTYIFVVMCASGMIVERDEENDVSYYSFGIGNAYYDMHKLIKWTRESFELLSIANTDTIIGELRVNLGSSADHVMIVPSENVEKLVVNVSGGKLESKLIYDESLVYKKEFNGVQYDTINAPVTHGQVVGTITYYFNGVELATVNAITKDGIESDSVKATLDTAKEFLFGDVMKTILIVIGCLILLYISASLVLGVMKIIKKANKKSKKSSKSGKNVNNPKKSSSDDLSHTREAD